MRESRKSPVRRRHRRALLALILIAGSPAFAEQPQQNTFRIMPPLPLRPIAQTARIQGNPFCAEPKARTSVQLASGKNSDSIRLKPIGAAIGLQEVAPAGPQNSRLARPVAPSIVIEPATSVKRTSGIRSNPLVKSELRPNDELVSAPLTIVTPVSSRPKNLVQVVDQQTPSDSLVTSAPIVHPATATRRSLPVHTSPSPQSILQTSESKVLPGQAEVNVALDPSESQTVQQDAAEPSGLAPPQQTEGHFAAMIKSCPNPSANAIQPEHAEKEEAENTSEPIFFSFSDQGAKELPAPVKIPAASPTPGSSIVETTSDDADDSESVALTKPISRTPISEPTSVLQSNEAGDRESSTNHSLHAANTQSAEVQSAEVQSAEVSGAEEKSKRTAKPLANAGPVFTPEGHNKFFSDPLKSGEESNSAVVVVEPIRLNDDAPVEEENALQPSILADNAETTPDLASRQALIKEESDAGVAAKQPSTKRPAAQPSLHTKRYRPPVAVKQVPVAFERPLLDSTGPIAIAKMVVEPNVRDAAKPSEEETSETLAQMEETEKPIANPSEESSDNAPKQSIVQGVTQDPAQPNMPEVVQATAQKNAIAKEATPKRDTPEGLLGPNVKLTPLHMLQAQVRSLTLGGSVRNVKVADKGVCQAFASGPNQLKLIGTGKGVTRLVVWAEPDGEGAKTLMRAFEVHVGELSPSEGDSVRDTAELLNQSIKGAFPSCQVTVQLLGGELNVVGQCDNKDSATKIIRMVRKSCLVPVRDQLSIR